MAVSLTTFDASERSEAERELLRLLALGEEEIAAGVGHPLDQVLAEADALLAVGGSGNLSNSVEKQE